VKKRIVLGVTVTVTALRSAVSVALPAGQ